jgi:ATP-binding cassette subfamily B multidrug efflux pump
MQEEIVIKTYDVRMIRRLGAYMWPYRRFILAAMFAMLLSAVLQLAHPWLMKLAIDRYIAHHDLNGILVITLTLLLVLILLFVIQFLQTYITQDTGQRIMSDLRLQVYTSLHQQPLAYYDQNPVGRAMTLVTSDIDALNDLFASGVVSVLANVVLLSGNLVASIMIDWRLTVVAFSVLPLVLLVTHWFRRNVRSSYRSVRLCLARINACLQENILGTATVRLFGQESVRFDLFETCNRLHRDVNIASLFYYSVFYPAIEFLSALAGALVLLVGGGSVIHNTLTLGALVAVLQYTSRVFQPISDLSEKFDLLQAAMAACERIFQLLDQPVTTTSSYVHAMKHSPVTGHIAFESVSFAYSDDHFVLRNLSFEIRPGERIAIVGPTGAGKSTVINLLLRFYEVTKGRILVDNVDIRRYDIAELRKLFGLVLQDAYIVAGSAEANIRLGDNSICDERIRNAIKAVHADRFIDRLPLGLDTMLPERGATLSAGEKQLLSLARAFAFDRPILVLDEATSNVDTEAETVVRDAVRVLMAGRTTIAISHRLSTVRNFDRILLLHHGELRESGTHTELLALRGLYHKLWQVQCERKDPTEGSGESVRGEQGSVRKTRSNPDGCGLTCAQT